MGAVDAGDEGLSVTVDCRLTLHVGESIVDRATVRRDLLEMDCVLGVDRFAVADGPYRIERW